MIHETTRRAPGATYRLQLNSSFTLRDAAALTDYLHALGVSHVYASPILRARPGSAHGYDICDYSQINPELGGQAALDELAIALARHGMGLILDTVPNHMGIDTPCNSWWTDVLENGPGSIYADYFDIDWQPLNPDLAGKVLLPILEDQYGTVLEQGKLQLIYEDGSFYITYWEHILPVAPRSYRHVLEQVAERVILALGAEHEHAQEVQSILTALSYLPPRTRISPQQVIERNREKEVIKRRLATLDQASPEIHAELLAALKVFNGDPADPLSFDQLDALIDAQAYRLADWRVATEEINYRRFFDINDLAALRVELPEVFDATHALILRLLAEGKAHGLRIDHIDGLYDPAAYLRQLQREYLRQTLATRSAARASGARGTANDDYEKLDRQVDEWTAWHAAVEDTYVEWPLYIAVEKILVDGEALPDDWAADGTSGYDFLNAVNGLQVDRASRGEFDAIYQAVNPSARDFHTTANSTRKMIMLISLASEINEISYQIERLAERTRRYRDFTLASLTFALREVIACLPVYRTYIAGPEQVQERDRAAIELAVAEAKQRNPRTSESLFEFLCDTLLLRNLPAFRADDRARLVELVRTFQQITGPVMAKGVEDTAFYSYNRLISLNEVGGQPERFGISVDEFHQLNCARYERWPHAMLATSTHDTKRSEDVRARINVLSEMPDRWQAAVARWRALNASKKVAVDGAPAPDANDEYLLYQTLVGAWPIAPYDRATFGEFRERIAAYMQKATKEAKVHTSWINPNHEYDAALRQFVEALLSDWPDDPFRADIEVFQQQTSFHGRLNSLSQTLLKLTAPGVPDLYQGSELWDLSLVDPDNRRPVDYTTRRALLDELCAQIEERGWDLRALAQQLLDNAHDGRVKLFVIERTLQLRRHYQGLFADGAYIPLAATGPHREHVCAFARVQGDRQVLVVVPRLTLRLTGGEEALPLGPLWDDTRLDLPEQIVGGRYRNLFTGAIVDAYRRPAMMQPSVAQILRHFPVALLERVQG
jgi:(1->4)-alpha-D-glucan 1-alpha-D-glucosylmutase